MNPLYLVFTLRRGSRLCEFAAHWRVNDAVELVTYLRILLALARASAASLEAA